MDVELMETLKALMDNHSGLSDEEMESSFNKALSDAKAAFEKCMEERKAAKSNKEMETKRAKMKLLIAAFDDYFVTCLDADPIEPDDEDIDYLIRELDRIAAARAKCNSLLDDFVSMFADDNDEEANEANMADDDTIKIEAIESKSKRMNPDVVLHNFLKAIGL